MGSWRTASTACLALSVCAVSAGAPGDEEVRDASVAMGYSTKARCPDLMSAD
jgi:hypothetical protein